MEKTEGMRAFPISRSTNFRAGGARQPLKKVGDNFSSVFDARVGAQGVKIFRTG